MKFVSCLILAVLLAVNTFTLRAQDAAAPATNAPAAAAGTNTLSEADQAWQEIQELQSKPTPKEWQAKPPTDEERAKFVLPVLLAAADKARDFYTRFPGDTNYIEAHITEHRMLNLMIENYGDTNQIARLTAADLNRLRSPDLADEERFFIHGDTMQKLVKDLPQKLDVYTRAALAFQQEFPQQQTAYKFLGVALTHSDGEQKVALAKQIAALTNCPASVKEEMKTMLARLEALGKPVPIKFTAVDGREVDLGNMKGKVVLVDFWATWCGPCKGEIPHVKAAYEKLHAQGFEIVGISFDQSKDALANYTAQQKMDWPQYFDGAGWGNMIGQKFGITSIPAMWLVDKQGNLRDMDARGVLEEKVTKLLAE